MAVTPSPSWLTLTTPLLAVLASPPDEVVAMMQRHGVLLPRMIYNEK
jgi:hypothetical protein